MTLGAAAPIHPPLWEVLTTEGIHIITTTTTLILTPIPLIISPFLSFNSSSSTTTTTTTTINHNRSSSSSSNNSSSSTLKEPQSSGRWNHLRLVVGSALTCARMSGSTREGPSQCPCRWTVS